MRFFHRLLKLWPKTFPSMCIENAVRKKWDKLCCHTGIHWYLFILNFFCSFDFVLFWLQKWFWNRRIGTFSFCIIGKNVRIFSKIGHCRCSRMRQIEIWDFLVPLQISLNVIYANLKIHRYSRNHFKIHFSICSLNKKVNKFSVQFLKLHTNSVQFKKSEHHFLGYPTNLVCNFENCTLNQICENNVFFLKFS